MHPFALYFSDGTVIFAGLFLVGCAVSLRQRGRRWAVGILSRLFLVTGGLLVILSATPWPLWVYGIWLLVLALIFLTRGRDSSSYWPRSLLTFFWVLSLGMAGYEAGHRRIPRVAIPEDATLYVIGDSISAGMGGEDILWPELLNRSKPFNVVNLARPGATVQGAFHQASQIENIPGWVLLEIGGNDLLGTTIQADFARQLDQLVSMLLEQGNEVIMMELPLYPFRNRFGQAQRSVARRHQILMIPKRVFARVLGTPGGTVDGLHLSQTGHQTMAESIAQIFVLEE
jgi:acyl-CoA thioesterase-1